MDSKYDQRKAYGAGGRAAMKLLHDPSRADRSDPPVPETLEHELSYYIRKRIGPNCTSDSRPSAESLDHRHLCKYCQQIFHGTGDPAPSATSTEYGPFFMHWSIEQLKDSAKAGCGLCLLVARNLKEVHLAMTVAQSLPGRYDFGTFMSNHSKLHDLPEAYALRFHYLALEPGKTTNLPPVTITLDKSQATRDLTVASINAETNDSDGSYMLAQRWIDRCQSLHHCSKSFDNLSRDFLPTRLIEVLADDETPGVRLVESKNIPAGTAYFTLSHCWGPSPKSVLQLRTSNMASFMKGISDKTLPSTFADAVVVTRRLQCRYLWIDSLCIVQDSEEDWAREAGLMWEVYTNSSLTISATASADPDQGLFRSRISHHHSTFAVQVGEGHQTLAPGFFRYYCEAEYSDLVDGAAVNQRAWVYQERLLSPRILHFSANEMFWECHGLQASEEFPEGFPMRYHISRDRQVLSSQTAAGSLDSMKMLNIWNVVVASYTRGQLTLPKDKLIAISAVAQHLARSFDSTAEVEYLAGLWSTELTCQLLWASAGQTLRYEEHIAPSWSWASIKGPITPNMDWQNFNHLGFEQHFRAMTTVAETISIPNDNNAFGSSGFGMLRLVGPLLKGKLIGREIDSALSHLDTLASNSVCFIAVNKPQGAAYVDTKRWRNMSSGQDTHYDFAIPFSGGIHSGQGRVDQPDVRSEIDNLFFIPILAIHRLMRGTRTPVDFASVQGLILESVEQAPGTFRRKGVFRFDRNAVEEFLCHLGAQKEEELVFEQVVQRTLNVRDFAFEQWSSLNLEFLPKEYKQYEVVVL